jgi:PAS domain S-box-containing protein
MCYDKIELSLGSFFAWEPMKIPFKTEGGTSCCAYRGGSSNLYINLKKCLLIFIFITFVSSLFAKVELTFREKEYLESTPYFVVSVSSNNYPYEYIDEAGKPSGIHINYIREILKYTNVKIVFSTEFDDNTPHFMSSFVEPKENYTLKTTNIHTSDIYFFYDGNLDPADAEFYITINQDFLLNKMIEKYPHKKHILSENLLKSRSYFDTNKSTVLVFDSFYKMYFNPNYDFNKNKVRVLQEDLRLHFYLAIGNDNEILYSIITKYIKDIEERNLFYENLKKYTKEANKNFNFHKFDSLIIVTSFCMFALFLFSLYAVKKYNLFHLNIQKLILRYRDENSILSQKIETLTYQLDSVKSTNSNLLQKINNLTILLDLKGNILHINDYCKKILGYYTDELIGQNIDKLVSHDDKQKLLNLSNIETPIKEYQITDHKDAPSLSEIEINTKDGLKKHFIFTTFFTKSTKGFTEINCILLNISDRKELVNNYESLNNHLEDVINQRIQATKESEERFKFVIEKAYNGIFVIKNNLFTLVNEALSVLTGYPQNNFMDKLFKFTDIIDPSLRDEVMNKIDENLKKNIGYFIITTKVKNSIGGFTDVEIQFSTTQQDNETILLGVISDISDKLAFEEKRINSERLELLTKYAITTNDKLNSPLNAINGYVELLEMTNKNPTKAQLKAYATIYESINIIKKVLHKLKSVTKFKERDYSLGELSMLDIDQNITTDKESNPDE